MILGGHLGGNTGLREMGTQGWQGFVSFGFVNNIETCRVLSHFNFLSMGLMRSSCALPVLVLVLTCTTFIILAISE